MGGRCAVKKQDFQNVELTSAEVCNVDGYPQSKFDQCSVFMDIEKELLPLVTNSRQTGTIHQDMHPFCSFGKAAKPSFCTWTVVTSD